MLIEKNHRDHPLSNQAIGIIDSGVGGLSIARHIKQQLPHEHLIYVADTLYAPYGDKSVYFIQQRINKICHYLVACSVKAIVIACNTATVNAIDQLRAQLKLPIIGVEPAIKPAAKQSKSKNVGILVTRATSKNARFKALIEKHHNGANVHIQPCPGLVELIEQGKLHSIDCQKLLRKYIIPLINNNVDTLVLGCTHYPFLEQQICAITGKEIQIIETAAPVTLQLANKLLAHNIAADQQQIAIHQFYSSKSSPQQQQLISQLWQKDILLQPLPC